jgi:CheY-like chemotaxis protein
LLVEDDPAVLSFLADLLAGDGLQVTCARTAVEALALLETGPAP